MWSKNIILFLMVAIVKNEKHTEDRTLGLDALHKVKIDKDTIITRNMNLKRKNREKDQYLKISESQETVRKPDWSYSSFPGEVKNHVEQFKRNMSECLKEVQANDERQVKILSPKKESPVHGECLIACVLKRNQVIDGGKINKENLLTLVRKFYEKDEKLMKKLEKNVDRCIQSSIKSKDDCELASHLNSCTNDLMAYNKHKIVVNY